MRGAGLLSDSLGSPERLKIVGMDGPKMSVSNMPVLKPILAKESERFAISPRQPASPLVTQMSTSSSDPDSGSHLTGIETKETRVRNAGRDGTNRQWYSSQHHPWRWKRRVPSPHRLSFSSSAHEASAEECPISEDPSLR